MITKEAIETSVRDVIHNITGLKGIDGNVNLVGNYLNINTVDFLYIFDFLSRQFEINVFKVVEANTFEIMTIQNLSDYIYKHISA